MSTKSFAQLGATSFVQAKGPIESENFKRAILDLGANITLSSFFRPEKLWGAGMANLNSNKSFHNSKEDILKPGGSDYWVQINLNDTYQIEQFVLKKRGDIIDEPNPGWEKFAA